MIFIGILLSVTLCIAAVTVPDFSWENRPQLIAFTFEGPLNNSKDASALLSHFSNGRMSCSDSIPATWFATDCTSDLQILQSNNYEIAIYNASQSSGSCLRSNATVDGVRVGNVTSASGLKYTMLESSSYIWPFVESNITRVPFVNVNAVTLMQALVENYDGARAPMVVSLSSMMQSVGADVTKLMLQEIMSLDEVVAITVGQLSQLANAKSASEAESVVKVCRLLTSTDNETMTTSPATVSGTSKPSQVNSRPQPSIALNGTSTVVSKGKNTNISAGAGTNGTVITPGNGNIGTAAPTKTPTSTNGTIITPGNGNIGTTAPTKTPTSTNGIIITPGNENIGTTAPTKTPTSSGANGTIITPGNGNISTTAPTKTPTSSGTNGTIIIPGNGNIGTIAPTDTPTLSPNVIGEIPKNAKTGPGADSNGSSETSSSKSTGYVPYVIGIGGGLCAMAVAIVYKVLKKEDRFPPVITNGYVFEAEDREIYDLEACNSSVRAVSESRGSISSSYVHSDLESVSRRS